MSRHQQRRQQEVARARSFLERRMNDLRSRLGLKPDAAPLPGEAAYEDTEIGRAPGQLPAASPFESTVPTKFRVISYDESNCKVEEFSDLADRQFIHLGLSNDQRWPNLQNFWPERGGKCQQPLSHRGMAQRHAGDHRFGHQSHQQHAAGDHPWPPRVGTFEQHACQQEEDRRHRRLALGDEAFHASHRTALRVGDDHAQQKCARQWRGIHRRRRACHQRQRCEQRKREATIASHLRAEHRSKAEACSRGHEQGGHERARSFR